MNQEGLSATSECPTIIKRAKLRLQPGNNSNKTNCAITDTIKKNIRNVTEISIPSNDKKLSKLENL